MSNTDYRTKRTGENSLNQGLAPAGRITGFTLIELLSVIAIIGILGGLILAGVGKARDMARQARCMSNLHQWGIGLQSYLQDNRGRIPYEGTEDERTWTETAAASETNSWFNVLPPYVGATPVKSLLGSGFGGGGLSAAGKKTYFTGENQIWQCLSDERATNSAVYVAPAYLMNSQIYAPAAPDGADGGHLLTVHDLPGGLSLSRIAFMTDAGCANLGGDRGRVRGHGDGQGGVDCRHNKGANVLFFDASVRKFTKAQIDGEEASGLVWNPWTAAQALNLQ